MSEALKATKLEVMIHWSENSRLDELACENKEDVFHDVEVINDLLRQAAFYDVKPNDGYDKTKYTLRVTDEKGETHDYNGRIDIGDDTRDMYCVVQDSVASYLNYLRNEGQETSEIIQWLIWMVTSKLELIHA